MSWLATFLLWAVALTQASASTIDRHQPEPMLKQATDELLAAAREARQLDVNERPQYYQQVAAILDEVIDREYVARGVMATYGSERLYKSLQTEQQRTAFKARIQRFADIMETVLIEKYADALLTFNGERIELESIASSETRPDKTSLLQTIYDEGNKTYKVQYNLHRKADGQWWIYNVIVEGINLGVTYRNQFSEQVEQNHGDVEYVVAHWKELMGKQKQSEQTGGD